MTIADFDAPAHDRMLDKVRLLLEHAEGATTEEEGATFTAKAYDLMSRYSIEEALVFAADREAVRPEPVQHVVSVPKDKAGQSLLGVAAESVGAKILLIRPFGNWKHEKARITSAYIIGYPNDVQMAEVLFTSLLVQMEREKVDALKRRPSWENGKTFANSFKWGFVATVKRRLLEVRESIIHDTPGAELVLYDKNAKVEAVFNEMFPSTSKRSGGTIGSGSGFRQGEAAGQRAKIDRSPLRENLTNGATKALT